MMNHRQIAGKSNYQYDPWRQRALDATRAQERRRGLARSSWPKRCSRLFPDKTPRLRYPIGQQAKSVARLRRFLPAGMYKQGVRRTFSLDKTQFERASQVAIGLRPPAPGIFHWWLSIRRANVATSSPLRGVSTVSFFAADHAAARKWYPEFLGAEPYFERPGYVEFRLGDYQHELGIIDSK